MHKPLMNNNWCSVLHSRNIVSGVAIYRVSLYKDWNQKPSFLAKQSGRGNHRVVTPGCRQASNKTWLWEVDPVDCKSIVTRELCKSSNANYITPMCEVTTTTHSKLSIVNTDYTNFHKNFIFFLQTPTDIISGYISWSGPGAGLVASLVV